MSLMIGVLQTLVRSYQYRKQIANLILISGFMVGCSGMKFATSPKNINSTTPQAEQGNETTTEPQQAAVVEQQTTNSADTQQTTTSTNNQQTDTPIEAQPTTPTTCSNSSGYVLKNVRAPSDATDAVHFEFVTSYEGWNRDLTKNLPIRVANSQRPLVLWLNSYHAIKWKIEGHHARIQRIYVSSYDSGSTVSIPNEFNIEIIQVASQEVYKAISLASGGGYNCDGDSQAFYSSESNPNSCSGKTNLVDFMKFAGDYIGLTINRFQGHYQQGCPGGFDIE